MGPFEMVVAIVFIVTIGSIVRARMTSRSSHGDAAAPPHPDAERMRDEIRQLKERIAVLERLATDGSSSLDREIERLRDR